MKLFYRLLDVLCVLLIFCVLAAYVIVATGIFERQLTDVFAVYECQAGHSLAACDWLEEFGSEATVLRAAQAGSEDR